MVLNTRALIKAPCGYPAINNRGEMTTEYPGVDCSLDCAHCGWNPKEIERRAATGKLVTKDGIQTLHFKRR